MQRSAILVAADGDVAPAVPNGGGGEPQMRVCKFFVTQGRCSLGDACPRQHEATSKADWVAARVAARRVASAAAGSPHAAGAEAKSHRAAVFCDWLLETFGRDLLCCGDGVLDVAGGRGNVAFELCVKRGVPTTTVDPRPSKLTRPQHKWLDCHPAPGGGGGADPRLPRHVEALFEATTWEQYRGCSLVIGAPALHAQRRGLQPRFARLPAACGTAPCHKPGTPRVRRHAP